MLSRLAPRSMRAARLAPQFASVRSKYTGPGSDIKVRFAVEGRAAGGGHEHGQGHGGLEERRGAGAERRLRMAEVRACGATSTEWMCGTVQLEEEARVVGHQVAYTVADRQQSKVKGDRVGGQTKPERARSSVALERPTNRTDIRPPPSSSRRPRTPRRCRPPRTSSSATRSPTTCSPSPGTPRAAGAPRRSNLVSSELLRARLVRGWSCAVVCAAVGCMGSGEGIGGGVPWGEKEGRCQNKCTVRRARQQGKG